MAEMMMKKLIALLAIIALVFGLSFGNVMNTAAQAEEDLTTQVEETAMNPETAETTEEAAAPAEPVAPAEPEVPTESEVPAEPAAPTEPAAPAEPEVPAEPAAPVEPVAPAEPEVPAEPAAPVEPVPPAEPIAPVKPVEPALPAELQASAETETPAETVNPAEAAETVVPAAEEAATPEAEEGLVVIGNDDTGTVAEELTEPVNNPETYEVSDFVGTAEIRLMNEGMLNWGDEIILKADVRDTNLSYRLVWEARDNNDRGWYTIGSGDEYRYILEPENATREYRISLYDVK